VVPFSEEASIKMAAKKNSKTSKKQSKSEFIRQQPATLSAAEVVAKAKAAGINFAPVLVYKVRGRAKKTKGTPKKAAAAKPTVVSVTKPSAATKAPQSKAAFVRGLPASTPAKDVVKLAKAAGIKLGIFYVYGVRRAAKTASKKKRVARTGASVPRPITTMSSAENLLKAVAAEIGLGPAIEILQGERARVRAVIKG
jgi:hypothetical protein